MRRAVVLVMMLMVLALLGWALGSAQARPASGQIHTLTLTASETLALSYYDGVTTRIAPQQYTELLFGNAPAARGAAWLRNYGLPVPDTISGTVYLRSYVRFPPVILPPYSQVTAASLYLDLTDCAPLSPTSTVQSFDAGVYPLLGNWTEETLVAWSDTAPAYGPVDFARSVERGATGVRRWLVTDIVADWHDAGGMQPGFLLSSSPAPDAPAGLIARADNRIGTAPPVLEVIYFQRTPPVLYEPVYAGARQVQGSGSPGESVIVWDVGTGHVLGTGLVDQDGAFTVTVSPTLVVGQRIQAHSEALNSNMVVVRDRPATEVPEGPTVALLGSGLVGLWAWMRRRRE